MSRVDVERTQLSAVLDVSIGWKGDATANRRPRGILRQNGGVLTADFLPESVRAL